MHTLAHAGTQHKPNRDIHTVSNNTTTTVLVQVQISPQGILIPHSKSHTFSCKWKTIQNVAQVKVCDHWLQKEIKKKTKANTHLFIYRKPLKSVKVCLNWKQNNKVVWKTNKQLKCGKAHASSPSSISPLQELKCLPFSSIRWPQLGTPHQQPQDWELAWGYGGFMTSSHTSVVNWFA